MSVVASDRVGGPGEQRSPGPLRRPFASGLVRHPLPRLVLRRVAIAIALLLVVSGLTFLLTSLEPGDAARQILGQNAPPEAYRRLRRELGLDLPLYEQYWRWLQHALAGDLGNSILNGESVTHAIGARLPVTLWLIAGSLLVTTIVGVGLGVLSAVRGGLLSRVTDALAMLGFSLPGFWVGAILIALFAVRFELFPATGYVPLEQSPGEWARSLVLPVVALALASIAAVVKQTREAMLDVLGSEYIRMARANGISERSLVFQHALKNAGIPVVTVLGVQVVGLLGGTVLIETVFSLPGLGGLVVSAALQHDLPIVLGVVVYFTIIVIVVNLVVDLAYTWLNPKVRAR